MPKAQDTRLERLLPCFAGAFALGLGGGLGVSGLPLIGACLTLVVLSLGAALQNSRRVRLAVLARAQILNGTNVKTLGDKT